MNNTQEEVMLPTPELDSVHAVWADALHVHCSAYHKPAAIPLLGYLGDSNTDASGRHGSTVSTTQPSGLCR